MHYLKKYSAEIRCYKAGNKTVILSKLEVVVVILAVVVVVVVVVVVAAVAVVVA